MLASVDGQLVPIPINLDTVNRLYGLNLTSFETGRLLRVAWPSRVEHDPHIGRCGRDRVGRELYEKFFRGYTRKQWGLDPSELDAAVTARVPVRTNRDDRYFTDTYQAMPLHGYTRMFENMLDHPNIKILLNTDYREIMNDHSVSRDDLHRPDRRVLRLSLRQAAVPLARLQARDHRPGAVSSPRRSSIIRTSSAYTRITEFKYLTGQEHPKTSIVYEFPRAEGDPYYPVPRPENAELYKQV